MLFAAVHESAIGTKRTLGVIGRQGSVVFHFSLAAWSKSVII